MRFFLSHGIKTKLALVFFAMPGVAILVGGVGLLGSHSAGRKFSRIGRGALPKAESAPALERRVSALAAEAIALDAQSEADPKRVAAVRAAVAALEEAVATGDDTDASTGAAGLYRSIHTAFATHEANAVFHFGFGGHTYALSAFFDALAVNNIAYLKSLSQATSFGICNNIETDPTATLFARWRPGFEVGDEDLLSLLADYAEREGDLLTYVEAFIVGDPGNAATEFTRLNARRMPKLEKTVAKLA